MCVCDAYGQLERVSRPKAKTSRMLSLPLLHTVIAANETSTRFQSNPKTISKTWRNLNWPKETSYNILSLFRISSIFIHEYYAKKKVKLHIERGRYKYIYCADEPAVSVLAMDKKCMSFLAWLCVLCVLHNSMITVRIQSVFTVWLSLCTYLFHTVKSLILFFFPSLNIDQNKTLRRPCE